jgi:hypothetical protein
VRKGAKELQFSLQEIENAGRVINKLKIRRDDRKLPQQIRRAISTLNKFTIAETSSL